MVDMIYPITGTVIRVPEDRVEKLEKAGYKKAVQPAQQKPVRSTRKKSE